MKSAQAGLAGKAGQFLFTLTAQKAQWKLSPFLASPLPAGAEL